MTKCLVLSFLLISVGFLHAGTVTFTYAGEPAGTTTVSGAGSFSYNGLLATIGLSDITAFSYELDLSTPGSTPESRHLPVRPFGPDDFLGNGVRRSRDFAQPHYGHRICLQYLKL